MKIERYLDRPDVFEYKVIDTSVIPFSPAVVEACKQNVCGRYGKTWTCPPGVGTLEELETKIKSWPKAAVFTCKFELEDSFDFEGMMRGQKETKRVLRDITDRMRAAGERFWALGNEGCGLCESCTYPDAPCRFPELASPSVEACGVNVMQLAKQIGVRYNNGPATVTYFSVILFGEET